ncbi:MAG: GNAT family N-acetyltransferase [Proteobacteria bacterium]|nr:GNAT family N-acetyltransferase [Pseudomonadota bacterium]
MGEYRFDENYEEQATLSDGTVVVLRCVRPSDKPLLTEGLAHLSKESRYRRFLTDRDHLSGQELRYLTEIDGIDHFALGAVRTGDETPDSGVGIARFVRLLDEPTVAEAAIAVVDEEQRKGLGKILLSRLNKAALERGILCFRSDILADNEPMLSLVDTIAPEALTRAQTSLDNTGLFTVDLELHAEREPRDAPHRSPMEELLKAAADGAAVANQALVAFIHWMGHPTGS